MVNPQPAEVLKKHLENEKDKMFRIAWKMCGNPEDAQEVLQETALKALKSWDKFRGEAQISTWLYRIASNTCLSKQRKKMVTLVDSDQLDFLSQESNFGDLAVVNDWSQDPLTQTLNDELRVSLDEAIMKLPEMYRLVFLMRDVEGLSGEQTAEALEISVSNVKVRLHRARIFLRQNLEDYVNAARGVS